MTARRTLPAAALQEILASFFDDRPHELAAPVAYWLTRSKAFAAFAQAYQPKIRKKIRSNRDAEESYSLYCELRTAYLLLQDPRLAVTYEPYTKQQGRSPDFAVTYRTHTTFHVEVTRLRSGHSDRRLTDVVCAKLRQLASGTPNVLFVWGAWAELQEAEIAAALLELKQRAEQGDEPLWTRHDYRSRADLIRHFQRLSAVVLISLSARAAAPLVWSNPDARSPLPARMAALLGTLVAADPSPGFAPDERAPD